MGLFGMGIQVVSLGLFGKLIITIIVVIAFFIILGLSLGLRSKNKQLNIYKNAYNQLMVNYDTNIENAKNENDELNEKIKGANIKLNEMERELIGVKTENKILKRHNNS